MSSNAIHGKNALIYLGSATAGAASPIGDQLDYSIDSDFPIVTTTPLNETWDSGVKGIMNWKMTVNGNFDPSSTALWDAHVDTGPQRMYLYPQASDLTKYYYGIGWVKLGKVVAGSTTAKASNGFSVNGNGDLSIN